MRRITNILKEYMETKKINNNTIDKNRFTQFLLTDEAVSIYSVKNYYKTLDLLGIIEVEENKIKVNMDLLNQILEKQRAKDEGWF